MKSKNFLAWCAILDSRTCTTCNKNNGKIFEKDKLIIPYPSEHPNCRCFFVALNAIIAGQATSRGTYGADWWLKKFNKLPDYYVSKQEAERQGWRSYQGNLHEVLPGMMITKRYYNINGRLPDANGRIWYEADINYEKGYRNTERILFSNDGLIFVTFDHYETFYEII